MSLSVSCLDRPRPGRMRRLLAAVLLATAALAVADATWAQRVASRDCLSAKAGSPHGLRLMAVGDIVLGNSHTVPEIPESWDTLYFAGVRPAFAQADLLVGNLEGALTDHPITRKNPGSGRQFAFRFPPRYAGLLAREGFQALHVANNHAYDFGETGFSDTLNHLEAAGIAPVGRKGKAVRLEVKGMTVWLIGFAYGGPFDLIQDLENATALVAQAKRQGGLVVVSFHGGAEGTPAAWHEDAEETFLGEKRGNSVRFARAMIDAGADLVFGHGPHVLRAAECYAGRPIFYSLGNFVGVGGLSNRQLNSASVILDATFAADGRVKELGVWPVRLDGNKVPQLDPQGFGARLMNTLAEGARYPGTFLRFEVTGEEAAFKTWFEHNRRGAAP